MWPRLSKPIRSVWTFCILYTAYILLVGGDVLEVHRFFIPLVAINAILFIVAVYRAVQFMPRAAPAMVTCTAVLAFALFSYFSPQDHVQTYLASGRGLNNKMQFLAERLKAVDNTNFSVAASTIGLFGYELIGHDLIDLVGLTDTMVSRHPQPPIPRLESDWREPHYNTPYLLERAPTYIIFSTGIKPTAPGEKALLLYDDFISSYRTIGFSYRPEAGQERGALTGLWRRQTEPVPPFELTHPPITAELFQRGIDAANAGDHQTAIARLDSARALSPQPVNPYLQYRKALSFLMLNQHHRAMAVMDSLLLSDSTIFEAHKDLYLYARLLDDTAKAAVHADWIRRLTPWYWPRAKEIADDEVARYKAARGN